MNISGTIGKSPEGGNQGFFRQNDKSEEVYKVIHYHTECQLIRRDIMTAPKTGGVHPKLGSRLRLWRISNGLKGQDLAAQIGISQGSLSDLENNKSHPSANTLAKLHKRSSINIMWLLTNKGEMSQ